MKIRCMTCKQEFEQKGYERTCGNHHRGYTPEYYTRPDVRKRINNYQIEYRKRKSANGGKKD